MFSVQFYMEEKHIWYQYKVKKKWRWLKVVFYKNAINKLNWQITNEEVIIKYQKEDYYGKVW